MPNAVLNAQCVRFWICICRVLVVCLVFFCFSFLALLSLLLYILSLYSFSMSVFYLSQSLCLSLIVHTLSYPYLTDASAHLYILSLRCDTHYAPPSFPCPSMSSPSSLLPRRPTALSTCLPTCMYVYDPNACAPPASALLYACPMYVAIFMKSACLVLFIAVFVWIDMCCRAA